jgi:L,D-transpeptidase YcbB
MTPTSATISNICVFGRRAAIRLGLAALVSVTTLGAFACGDSRAPGAPSANAAAPRRGSSGGFFSRGVELELGPYLNALSAPPLELGDATSSNLRGQVRSFYAHRQDQPVWFVDGKARPEAKQLVELLSKLDAQDLDPIDYRPAELSHALDAVAHSDASTKPEDVEVGLTWAALLAASDLRYGRVMPKTVEARWLVERDKVDLVSALQRALDGGGLQPMFEAQVPSHPQYAALLGALQRYREIAVHGGWPVVPKGPVLVEGKPADAARLRALAERLQAEGFLAAVPPELASAAPGSKARYSKDLADAVARFQNTRTVEIDGSLGPETQEELNVPVLNRLRQIALNVERWRWVPDDFGPRAVLVNLPGYRLDVEESTRPVMSMRVVVGQEGWETPVFADRIRFLVLNPYWNVPPNIVRAEILPKLASDPGYVAEHDMELVSGERDDSPVVLASRIYDVGNGVRLRQRPGGDNPLGQIKFMFPNKYDIYLHDTPSGAIFEKADRSESHGCIRLEHPMDLAHYLLRDDPKWSVGQLEEAIASGETKEVPLAQPVPVYLLYFTAAPMSNGAVAFYEDIYDIDRAHSQAWAAVESRRRAGAAAAVAKEAMQQQPGNESTYVGEPRHTHGADAWRGRQRPGAFHQLQGKPGEKP